MTYRNVLERSHGDNKGIDFKVLGMEFMVSNSGNT